ncbi:MAG: hypothetical protein R6U00_08930, partial [Prochlorococcaceae cyanobacterium]
ASPPSPPRRSSTPLWTMRCRTRPPTWWCPNTDYRLLYGTVEPVNDQSVRFAVDTGGGETYFDADCNRGTLNGRNPTSASEAELLNAACQVAFGSV